MAALQLIARAIISSGSSSGNSTRSRTRRKSKWSSYGRWILAALVIAIAIFLIFAILIRMRRRKALKAGPGQAPVDGVAMKYESKPFDNNGTQAGQQYYAPPAGKPLGGEYGNQNAYNNNNNAGHRNGEYNNNNAPVGGYGGSQQESGVAQPQNAYQR